MRIDKRLNLVFPIEQDDAVKAYIHSTPISREVFEKFFLVISKAFAAIYAEGLNVIAGPRVAALMLKKIAVDMGVWDGEDGAENGLMNEIRRLSNVIAPGPNGWVMVPLQEALDKEILDPDDVSEAESAIVFFILASAMHKRNQIQSILDGMGPLWGTQTELLNSTAFASSLPTLTGTANSGATVAASSLPS